MTITFHHPPTGTVNPLIDFEPWNTHHYPKVGEAGLYIYGIRAKVDRVLKFIPIVVGESGDLHNRLFNEHYMSKFVNPLGILLGNKQLNSGDPKEIWDFSQLDLKSKHVSDFYLDTNVYNTRPPKSITKAMHVSKLKHLIFFQDANFYHYRMGIAPTPWVSNLRIEESVYYLTYLARICGLDQIRDLSELSSRLLITLNNFKEHFYYVYASQNNQPESEDLLNEDGRKAAEHQVKDKLKNIHIHTTADSKNVKYPASFELDLTNIQERLVNLHDHQFDNVSGEYVNLIL